MVFKTLFALTALVASVGAASVQKRTVCPNGDTVENGACCAFAALRDDLLANLFGGVCGEEVHETLRLAFHDAIGFSTSQGPSAGGGADGSPIQFPDVEPNFAANLGISDSVTFLTPFLSNHSVSAGDLIHVGAAIGITLCPGAPQLEVMVGRPVAVAPAIDGLVPEPQNNVDQILARMADGGGFSAFEVASLLVSHTIGRSDHIDPTIHAVPFDSTPFEFDTQFFIDIQLRGTGFPGDGPNQGEEESPLPQTSGVNVGEIRLQSDAAFARSDPTSCTFQSFATDQELMSSSFKAAMAKMQVIGQPSTLIDCSEIVPTPLPASGAAPMFPPGKTNADVEQACATSAFPTLATKPGAVDTLIAHCPPQQGGLVDLCDTDEGSL